MASAWPLSALAILTAAAVWWHLGSIVGRGLSAAVRNGFGEAAWTVPVLLALLAWRYLRHPDRNADNARMVIGWTALLIGGLGLLHIAHGTPRHGRRRGRDPGRGRFHRLRRVGAAGGRRHRVGGHAAARAGHRVRPAGHHRHAAAPGAEPPGRAARLRARPPGRGHRGRGRGDRGGWPRRAAAARLAQEAGAIEAGDHTRPYDSPLLGGTIRGPGRSGDAAKPVAPGEDGADSEALAFSGPVAGTAPRPRAGTRWTGRTPSPARARPGTSRRAPAAGGAGQARAADADRRHRRQLHAAARGAAAPGHRAEEPDPGQRPDGRGAAERAASSSRSTPR